MSKKKKKYCFRYCGADSHNFEYGEFKEFDTLTELNMWINHRLCEVDSVLNLRCIWIDIKEV